MSNELCHFEFMSNDVTRCRRFYETIFDWKFDEQSMPGYTLIQTGREPGGGLMQRPESAPRPCFMVYFMVDDIPATLRKAEQAGGKVLKPETPIPGVGAFAVFGDPDGNAIGVFKPRPR
jgi:hypothetical protein